MLCQIGIDGKRWIYPKKADSNKLGEIHRAIFDFSLSFFEYINNTSTLLTISGEDAAALYMQGLPQIRNILKQE